MSGVLPWKTVKKLSFSDYWWGGRSREVLLFLIVGMGTDKRPFQKKDLFLIRYHMDTDRCT